MGSLTRRAFAKLSAAPRRLRSNLFSQAPSCRERHPARYARRPQGLAMTDRGTRVRRTTAGGRSFSSIWLSQLSPLTR